MGRGLLPEPCCWDLSVGKVYFAHLPSLTSSFPFSGYVAQADFKLVILLPSPPKYWDFVGLFKMDTSMLIGTIINHFFFYVLQGLRGRNVCNSPGPCLSPPAPPSLGRASLSRCDERGLSRASGCLPHSTGAGIFLSVLLQPLYLVGGD